MYSLCNRKYNEHIIKRIPCANQLNLKVKAGDLPIALHQLEAARIYWNFVLVYGVIGQSFRRMNELCNMADTTQNVNCVRKRFGPIGFLKVTRIDSAPET